MTVSIESLKAHLNLTTNDDDALLTDKLAAATAWVSSYTGIAPDAADVPAPVDEAVRQLAAHLYENREASLVGVTSQALPFGLSLRRLSKRWLCMPTSGRFRLPPT